MNVQAFRWKNRRLFVLDQRLLPHKTKYIVCRDATSVAKTIRDMAVRGAPAIGCCAAYGMVLANRGKNRLSSLKSAARILKKARPTAVNLAWAVDVMLGHAEKSPAAFEKEAIRIEKDDVQINKAIGEFGQRLFRKNSVVLTHCNTGSLATAGYGTALGVIRSLKKKKKLKHVFVDETRPYLQGARLTAWECSQEKIPYDVISDNMAAHLMKTEKIDGIVVGCDRVAANGDAANKIGTYSLAVLAHYHKIPFYVAMPTSTLDLDTKSGDRIPIEERSQNEVLNFSSVRVAPKGATARHPAFDVTPARFITGIITEFGVVKPPYRKNLKKIKDTGSRIETLWDDELKKDGLLKNR